jgi:hypothetical protein
LPLSGGFLFPERHPRLERRHVREIVGIAACREGDRLQRTLDVKFLKRGLPDTEAQPAVGRA